MKRNKNQKTIFWHERAVHYDKLFWTKDKSYLDAIIRAAGFKKNDLVLDVGTGTGTVASRIKPIVGHVVGIDISDSMLSRKKWDGISMVKWNVCEALFANSIFDKVVARMCFHHIVDNLDLAVKRCRALLKPGGKIIVAEGVPPSDDPRIVKWYEKMFKLKEKRLIFTEKYLKNMLAKNGFRKIKILEHQMKSFSIKNWLLNSGIERKNRQKIMALHQNAEERIKKAYNMVLKKDDCLVDTKHMIIIGIK